MGPINPSTYQYGARYIVTFIYDYTRYSWAYPITDKVMVHVTFAKKLDNAKSIRACEIKISWLRMDNGTEYMTEGN